MSGLVQSLEMWPHTKGSVICIRLETAALPAEMEQQTNCPGAEYDKAP